jgi:hypothetical protein
MSENRIAPSKPKRRTGCSVTSAASSGVKHSSRNPPARLRTSCTREIAAGLPHQPDRRHGLALAVQHIEQRFMHGGCGHDGLRVFNIES